MRSWKDRLKRSLVLLLTVALVGNSARYAMLSVSAEEILEEEADDSKEQEETLSAEEPDENASSEEQNDDTETVIVQDAGTVTAEAMNTVIAESEPMDEEEEETSDEAENTKQPASEETEADENVEETAEAVEAAETGETPEEAEEADESADEEEIVEQFIGEIVDLGDTYTSAEGGISLFSIADGTVDLAAGNHVNWIDRISLPDYAKSLYNTLVESSDNDGTDDQLISDAFFSEDNATTLNYSDGSSSKFNGIKVLEETRSTQISSTEWQYIQNSIRAVYDAFDRDHPEVFWLSGGTQAMLSGSIITSSGETTYKYTVYFLLKIIGEFRLSL